MSDDPIEAWLDGAFPSMAPLREQLRRGARSDAPLLIVGEPGVGRTSLARALHSASPRATRALVEVDVGSIPVELFESDLFGHVAGAFTGAERERIGKIGAALGGTLLLDRVEELPISVQPKLLRFLSERVYSPLGGRETSSDLRVLAVASHDLALRVERGDFRRDLFHRLEVIAFEIPPLRRRPGDLEAALPTLLDDLSRRYGRAELAIAEEDLRWMLEHAWPGNLRQVRNLLERAAVLQGEGVLRLARPVAAADECPRTLEETERAAIVQALSYTRGHQGKAAALLGISRKGLWEKRKRHGIP